MCCGSRREHILCAVEVLRLAGRRKWRRVDAELDFQASQWTSEQIKMVKLEHGQTDTGQANVKDTRFSKCKRAGPGNPPPVWAGERA